MKKVLIIGNHTCANRGDGAILRGLLGGISKRYANVDCTVISRYPEVASIFLDGNFIIDSLYHSRHQRTSTRNRVLNRLHLEISYWKLRFPKFGALLPIPNKYLVFQKFVNQFDLIIQVGGSFFTDLYGIHQYENLLQILAMNKPIVFAGHSIGPFKSSTFRRYSRLILPRIDWIVLRESVSLDYVNDLEIPLNNFRQGGDTAWLISKKHFEPVVSTELRDLSNKTIAITFRDLKPFDKRLQVTQEEYELYFVNLINWLISEGYHILGVSMCTGLQSYNRDDRIIAYRVRNKLKNPDKMKVLFHEYSDLELGNILQRCKLLIGTRLHSTILALLNNTPVIGIYYEHKFKGLFEDMKLHDFLFDVKEIDKQEIQIRISEIIKNYDPVKKNLQRKVIREIERAMVNLETIDRYFLQ